MARVRRAGIGRRPRGTTRSAEAVNSRRPNGVGSGSGSWTARRIREGCLGEHVRDDLPGGEMPGGATHVPIRWASEHRCPVVANDEVHQPENVRRRDELVSPATAGTGRQLTEIGLVTDAHESM